MLLLLIRPPSCLGKDNDGGSTKTRRLTSLFYPPLLLPRTMTTKTRKWRILETPVLRKSDEDKGIEKHAEVHTQDTIKTKKAAAYRPNMSH